MMSKKTLLVIALGTAIIVAALVWAFSPRPVNVEVAEVTRGLFEQTIDDDGKTRVRERYVVSAPLAGRLQRLTLKAGDVVERDAVVALLRPVAPPLIDAREERELESQVSMARAGLARAATAVERARIALAQARADAQRTKKLAAEGFVSSTQLERDELNVALSTREVAAAEFERQAAEHQLALARAALTRSRQGWQEGRGEQFEIRSPVAGRVLRVAQESEAVVKFADTLLEIGDPSDLEVVVDVLSGDALQIAAGQAARLERQGVTAPLEGRVRKVEPSAFTKISALGVEEQRVNVVIDIVSPRAQWQNLGDAYRIDARIVVHKTDDAVQAPVAALFRDGARWAVFVADGNIARKRIIESSRRNAQMALVEKGLAAGDRVIAYPGDAVRDGGKIVYRNLK
ncbi:MAG: HlyD family efflux transporter periplasmic adaptor subunit [Betaproteobacteria bacterium]|nr:HlyD family efflux transporter periplasmic adaptor subunit [Betaproteobacteria bacterium]MDH4293954.1 HlyD family efflux transporter periplasmic adaptor subunit [Betaproteobacteria bacterium]MDH5343194.1 HlyD family efflux transporter periplasmic adaptor subunit [Betaproteobacteria bacterium]